MTTLNQPNSLTALPQSSLSPSLWFGLLISVLIGATAAWIALPVFSDLFAHSLVGADAKGCWYLSRASGVTSYVLFWVSMMMGLLMSTKTTRLWSTGPTILVMHEFTSIIAVLFALFHALILLGDAYIKSNLLHILTPFMMQFGTAAYMWLWIGFGQIGFYLLTAILISFYVRSRIGYGVWRWLHFGTFVAYMLVTVHGMLVGSDTQTSFMLSVYAFTNASMIFLTIYRVLLMNQAKA